jgi:S1-C subfamily serine protease
MRSRSNGTLLVACCAALFAQSPAEIRPEQLFEKAYPSVALVVTGSTAEGPAHRIGTALVVRENGVLLTAYHVVRDAHALQVRFKNGEIFDQVQLLGVDTRRDIAALKIPAAKLPVMPMGKAEDAKPGEPVAIVSHPAGLQWSGSAGVVSAHRVADEVPGAGSGYRLIQFTAPVSRGSSGGVLIDARGAAIGLAVGSAGNGQNLNFAVPLESVIGLADAPVTKAFANGAALTLANEVSRSAPSRDPSAAAAPDAAERSDILAGAKDRETVLRSFKTMYVDAMRAQYFRSDQMKASLARNKDFAGLNIRIVDDRKLADTVLEVGYTAPWDFPFALKHQNTSTVLLAGKGTGPFSGPAGAASVAREFIKLAKPHRTKP